MFFMFVCMDRRLGFTFCVCLGFGLKGESFDGEAENQSWKAQIGVFQGLSKVIFQCLDPVDIFTYL